MMRHWWLITLNQQQRCKTIRAVTKTNLNSALFFLPPGSFDQNSKPLTCMEWSLFTQGHPLPLFRQGDVLLVFHVPSVLNFAGSTTGIFKSAWMFIFCTYLLQGCKRAKCNQTVTSTDCMPLIGQGANSLDESWERPLQKNQTHQFFKPGNEGRGAGVFINGGLVVVLCCKQMTSRDSLRTLRWDSIIIETTKTE